MQKPATTVHGRWVRQTDVLSVFPWFHSFCRLELTSQFAGLRWYIIKGYIGLPDTCPPPALSVELQDCLLIEKLFFAFANINSSLFWLLVLSGIAFFLLLQASCYSEGKWHFPPDSSSVCLCSFFLKLLVHGQSDLWRNVNEPLTRQKARRPWRCHWKLSSSSTMLFSQSFSQRRRINSLNLLSARECPFFQLNLKTYDLKSHLHPHHHRCLLKHPFAWSHSRCGSVESEICEFCSVHRGWKKL